MNKLWRYPLFIGLAMCGLFCIEQILYRFSEEYAKHRADLLRSLDKNESGWNWLKSVPFDQWVPFPDHAGKEQAELLTQETQFMRASLSHTRALRDKLFDELRLPVLPSEMLLRDTKKAGVVYLQIPRGKETKIKAIVLRVLDPSEQKFEDLDDLQKQIIPMERQGFACGFILPKSERDLLRALEDDLPAALNNMNDGDIGFAHRIFAWGKGSSANLLARAFSESPERFAGVVIDSPIQALPPIPKSQSRILFFTDENTDDAVCGDALLWLRELRKSSSFSIGSMLSHGQGSNLNHDHYKLALTYGFIKEVDRALGPVREAGGSAHQLARPMSPSASKDQFESGTPNPRREENASPLALSVKARANEEEGSPLKLREDDFDCKTVQIFRQNPTDTKLLKLNNKDLILFLGKFFEDKNALDVKRLDDPDFVTFYENFKQQATAP
ncbi:MAG: hypothetical protein VB980_00585 [Opitutales bacterium]